MRGKLPDKPQIEQILKEFGIGSPLQDAYIDTDKGNLPDMPQLNELMNEIGIEKSHDNRALTDIGFSQANIIIPTSCLKSIIKRFFINAIPVL